MGRRKPRGVSSARKNRGSNKKGSQLMAPKWSNASSKMCKVEIDNLENPQPSTSKNTMSGRKQNTFKKFRDKNIKIKTLKRLNRKHVDYRHPNPNSSNKYVQKLLRSIKRRQVNKSPRQNCKSPRKLNFGLKEGGKNPTRKKRTLQKASTTIEESEIVSSEECNSDEDCVLIDYTAQHVTVIDDDDDNNNPSESMSQTFVSGEVIASTPKNRSPFRMAATTSQTSSAKRNVALNPKACCGFPSTNFFFDNSGQNCSRSASSHYVTLSRLSADDLNSKHRLQSNNTITTDDLIIVDETICDSTLKAVDQPNNADDSVIFVSETNPNDFIPLISSDVPNPIIMPVEEKAPKRTRVNNSCNTSYESLLLTTKEKKQMIAYNNNAYNPSTSNNAQNISKKRMVLIDGSNVAYGHSLCKEFSVKGLKICLDYFEKIGHEVKAVVPMFRKNFHKSSNPALLDQLHKDGKIVFTPCKNLPGLTSSSYDDRFILQLASEMHAAIVSNDNYRDLLNENTAFKKIIENRVIGYSWCNDIFILPKDPYGRWGPTLDSILNRT